MIGKIIVGGQGVDVRENRGRDGYRRWDRKSSKRVGSGRNRGNDTIFRNRKGLKWRKARNRPGSWGCKIREVGGLDRHKCIFVIEVCFLGRGVIN